MQSRTVQLVGRLFSILLISAGGLVAVSGQPFTVPPPAPVPSAKPMAADALVWDSILKELTPLPGQTTAD